MFYIKIIFYIVKFCLSLCEYMHMSSGLTEFRGIGSLELDLQVIVSHLTWVLAAELRSSARAISAFTAEPFFQPLNVLIFKTNIYVGKLKE